MNNHFISSKYERLVIPGRIISKFLNRGIRDNNTGLKSRCQAENKKTKKSNKSAVGRIRLLTDKK